ncbi:hypothetical protein BDV96DRAFT_576055 [Lophiotrema nucula]|uniref:Uncharacterized protein n=1 Tax=Lophiotrema nucula TaxID=690887 RepID=A0A6A5Z5Z8_9PLEO|nr:hypothetical protein BDV96DRAFT_576055 [Lophiotrema nucula]
MKTMTHPSTVGGRISRMSPSVAHSAGSSLTSQSLPRKERSRAGNSSLWPNNRRRTAPSIGSKPSYQPTLLTATYFS